MNRTDNGTAAVVAYTLMMVTAFAGPGWLFLPYLVVAVWYGRQWARQHREYRIARIQDRQRRYGRGGTI